MNNMLTALSLPSLFPGRMAFSPTRSAIKPPTAPDDSSIRLVCSGYRPRLLQRATLYAIVLVPAGLQAAVFDVTSVADAGPGSLREAMTLAAAVGSGPHSVRLMVPDHSVIELQTTLPGNHGVTLEIDGSNRQGVVLDGVDAIRLFDTGSNSPLTLKSLTVRNGRSQGHGGCIRTNYSTSPLTLDAVTVEDCRAMDAKGQVRGGGVYSAGTLAIRRSQFLNNVAESINHSASGGAAYSPSELVIEDSLFQGNLASGASSAVGGAATGGLGTNVIVRSLFIENGATVQTTGSISSGGALYLMTDNNSIVSSSLFLNNQAVWASAVFAGALSYQEQTSASLTNNTFVGNSGNAALRLTNAMIDLRNNTFWKNAAPTGSGNIAAHLLVNGTQTQLQALSNNLFAHTDGGANACASFSLPEPDLVGSGHNLFTDNSCHFIDSDSLIIGGDLRIRGLRFTNASDTMPVVELLAGSPAIDNGSPETPGTSTASACMAIDGRGAARPGDGDADGDMTCDIGSMELVHESSLFVDDFEPMLMR